MYTLITNTGKQHECSFFGITPMDFAVATIENEDFLAVAAEFAEPKNTEKLTARNENGNEMTVRGYIVLKYIEKTGSGVKVALARYTENTP